MIALAFPKACTLAGLLLFLPLSLPLSQSLQAEAASLPEVALTLDDLPVHGAILPGQTRTDLAERIIAILQKHGIGPTHAFVNGFGAETPDGLQALRDWVAAGNKVANHTYSHLDLNGATTEQYLLDIEADLPFVSPFSAASDPLIFRYPDLHEGETLAKREAIRGYLFGHGYRIGQVTIDSSDWAYTAPYIRCANLQDTKSLAWMKREFLEGAAQKLQQMRKLGQRIAGREVRQILLVHASAFELTALDELITAFEKAGVRFISLPEALEDPIYSIDTGWVSEGGKAFLDQIAAQRRIAMPAGPILPASQLDKICGG